MRLFEGLVKGVGMGFVMIGGEDSFGAGGWQGTPIEDLLPVYMEIKQKKVLPNRGPGDRHALLRDRQRQLLGEADRPAAIRVLSPRDYAGVLYYGGMGGESWLFPMTPCSQKSMMLSLLSTFARGTCRTSRGSWRWPTPA